MLSPVNPYSTPSKGSRRVQREEKITPIRESCFQVPLWDLSHGELFIWESIGELYVQNPSEQAQYSVMLPVEPFTNMFEVEILGEGPFRVGWSLINYQEKEGFLLGSDDCSVAIDLQKSKIYHHGSPVDCTPSADATAKLITAVVKTGEADGPSFSWIVDGKIISPSAPLNFSSAVRSSLAFVPTISVGPMQELRINVGNTSWKQLPSNTATPAPLQLLADPVRGLSLLWPTVLPEGLRICRNGLDIGNYSDQTCVLSLMHLELARLSQIAFEVTLLDVGDVVPLHRKSNTPLGPVTTPSAPREGLRVGWAPRSFCQEAAREFKRLGDDGSSVAYDLQARTGMGDPRAFVPAAISDPRITAALHKGLHLMSTVTAVRIQEQDWLVFKFLSDLREKKPNVWNSPSSDEFVPTVSIPPGMRIGVNIGQRPFEVPLPKPLVPLLSTCASALRPPELWLRRTGVACATCDTGQPIYGLAFRCLECDMVYSCIQHAIAHGHCMVGLAADALEDWGCTVRDIIPHLDLEALKAWIPELLLGRCGMCQLPLGTNCFVSIQNQLARLCPGCFNEALRVEDPYIGADPSLRHFLVLPLPSAAHLTEADIPAPSCQLALLFYPDEKENYSSNPYLAAAVDTSLPLSYTSARMVSPPREHRLAEGVDALRIGDSKKSTDGIAPSTSPAKASVPPLQLKTHFPLLPVPPLRASHEFQQLAHNSPIKHSFSPRVPGTGDGHHSSPRFANVPPGAFNSPRGGSSTSPRGPALRHHAPPKPFSDSPTVFYVPKKKKHPPAALPEVMRKERQQMLQASLKAHEAELDVAASAPPPAKLKYTWAVVPYEAKDKK